MMWPRQTDTQKITTRYHWRRTSSPRKEKKKINSTTFNTQEKWTRRGERKKEQRSGQWRRERVWVGKGPLAENNLAPNDDDDLHLKLWERFREIAQKARPSSSAPTLTHLESRKRGKKHRRRTSNETEHHTKTSQSNERLFRELLGTNTSGEFLPCWSKPVLRKTCSPLLKAHSATISWLVETTSCCTRKTNFCAKNTLQVAGAKFFWVHWTLGRMHGRAKRRQWERVRQCLVFFGIEDDPTSCSSWVRRGRRGGRRTPKACNYEPSRVILLFSDLNRRTRKKGFHRGTKLRKAGHQ